MVQRRKMAEIVYLKRGERPPRRDRSPFLLIVCRRRGGDAMQIGADGTIQTIRTTPEYIARNISGVRERLGESGQKIYVQWSAPLESDRIRRQF